MNHTAFLSVDLYRENKPPESVKTFTNKMHLIVELESFS